MLCRDAACTVPESVLKRRKAVEKLAAARLVQRADQLKKNKRMETLAFKRAEEYAREYIQKEREAIRMKRVARNAGNYYVAEQPKLAFVIRIKGYRDVFAVYLMMIPTKQLV